MSPKETFQCKVCGGKKEADTGPESAPECCDAPMEKMSEMDACTVSSTAEHSRFDDTAEPCDDGRAGKI